MYWTKYYIPTLKETPVGTEAVSHQLLLRAGLVHMLISGVYSYLPLGLRVLSRVESIICEEMDAIGANKLILPCLQPMEIWEKTGRDKTLSEVMYKFKDKRNRLMCLGPTHEEVITDLVKDYVHSYRQLPVVLYQIQTKFRDEIRSRFGIVRACEFIMKDAYSFDRNQDGLKKNYQLMYQAYEKIFLRCGLNVVIAEADSGAMGGDVSHEFMVPAPIGEDTITLENGQQQIAIELGHIFQLGTKYSEAQGAHFIDEDGSKKPIIMGCYGIGVSRVIAAIIEVNNDDNGIIWPMEVAPFHVEIIPLLSSGQKDKILSLATDYYQELVQSNITVLLDDRDETAGRKFNDADLIGIPFQIIIGDRKLSEGKVEIKNRRTKELQALDKNEAIKTVKDIFKDRVCSTA